MLQFKLTSIIVNDQDRARSFYTETLGFVIKHDIPCGDAAWLTVVHPGDYDGVELLLEFTRHPATLEYQQAMYCDGIPVAQFHTDDLCSEYRRLASLGVEFLIAPTTVGQAHIAHFDDTCGNLIRLIQC